MGNGVTQFGSGATRSDEDEKRESGGLADQGKSSEAPHRDSDSFASKTSNGDEVGIASHEKSRVMGLPVQKVGRRILIVDDETAIADTLSLIFQLQRYDVRVAYT